MGRNEPPGGPERQRLTLREWVVHAAEELARVGVDSPRVDASLILCHVLTCDRTHLLAHPTDLLNLSDQTRAADLLARRLRREPLPHLLGEWEFMGHRYEVGPQALIPRPETEGLVEAVVERLRLRSGFGAQGFDLERGLTPQPPFLPGKGEPYNADGCDSALPSPGGRGAGGEARVPLPGKGEPYNADGCDSALPSPGGRGAGGEARVPHQPLASLEQSRGQQPYKILDVGTGTGCIAVELAFRLPKSQVTSVDISPEALDLARRNAAHFQLEDRVAFRHARFPDEVRDLGPFDAIVSNPPYIPSAEVDRLEPELTQYEPRTALDGGPDGLDVIRHLAVESRRLLKPGGLLAMEIGHDQSESVESVLRAAGWTEIQALPDLAGHLRVVLAY